MKKFATIATIGLSCALALSLAACGGDPAPEEKPSNKAPNPDDIKTEQVSETEWKSAFDFSSTNNLTFKRTNIVTTMGKSDTTYALVMFDGNKIYQEEVKNELNAGATSIKKVKNNEYYSILADDDKYIYTYNDSSKKWEKESTDWCPTIEYYLNQVDGVINAYSSFTYTPSKNAYVSTELTSSGFDTISVKIVDGKVAVVQMDVDRTNGSDVKSSQSLIYQAYDIGKTNVSLPKIEGESGGGSDNSGSSQVTKESWESALSPQAFYNVTYIDTSSTDDDEDYSRTYRHDYENNCVLSEGKNSNSLYIFNGDSYILYDFYEGEWHYEGFENKDFDNYLERITNFFNAVSYKDFTFNGGEYVAANISIFGQTLDSVHFKFDAGKLVECGYEMHSKDGQGKEHLNIATMKFSDYGKTHVDLSKYDLPEPDDGGNNGPRPPEEGDDGDESGNGGSVSIGIKQWDAAFKPESFYNCIVDERIEDENGVTAAHVETWVDYDNRRAHLITDMDSASYDYIIAEVGGSYYMYLYIGSNYMKQETTAADLNEVYSNCFANFEMFVGDFEQFKYDEKTQSYVAHKYTLAALDNKIADEVRIHFVDGRVDSVVLIITEDGSTYTEYWNVTNYNATVIEVPVLEK